MMLTTAPADDGPSGADAMLSPFAYFGLLLHRRCPPSPRLPERRWSCRVRGLRVTCETTADLLALLSYRDWGVAR